MPDKLAGILLLPILLASPAYADESVTHEASRTTREVLVEQAHWKGKLWQRYKSEQGDFWVWSDMYGVPLPNRMRMALPEKPPPARGVATQRRSRAN